MKLSVGEAAAPPQQRLRDLVTEAKLHMCRTACTVLNKETGRYEFHSVWRTDPKKMRYLGVGVQLYFEFTKLMGIVFLIMAVLSVPALFFNGMGSMVDNSSWSSTISKLSVANLGRCPAAGCQSREELRERCAFTLYLPLLHERDPASCDLKVIHITEWLGLLDAISIFIFFIFSVYFTQRWLPRTVRETDNAKMTCAAYTIWIPSLPKFLPMQQDTYACCLEQHFKAVLQTLERDAVGKAEAEDAIHEVTLVHDYQGAIMSFSEKGKHLRNRENAIALKEKHLAKGYRKAAAKQEQYIVALDDKVSKIDRRIKDQAKKTDQERGVCGAFITFQRVEYKEKVMEEYRFANHALFRLCQSVRLRFSGSRIKVMEACEPTDLQWENLDYCRWKRLARQAGVIFLAYLVLVVCSAMIASLESLSNSAPGVVQRTTWVVENRATSGSTCLRFRTWDFYETPCGPILPNSRTWTTNRTFDSTGNITSLQDHRRGLWQSPACLSGNSSSAHLDWIGIEFSDERQVQCMRLIQEDGALQAHELRIYACPRAPTSAVGLNAWRPSENCQAMEVLYPATGSGASRLMPVVPDTSCARDPANYVTYAVARQRVQDSQRAAGGPAADPTVACYCQQQSLASGNVAGFMTPPYDTPQKALCKEWGMEMAKMYSQSIAVVLAVVVLNRVLLGIYSYLSAWERRTTVTEVTRSQLWKLFLSQFVNTGLLIILVNARIQERPQALFFLRFLSIGEGSYQDINAQWYTAVGATLVVTIFMEIFTTTVPPLLMACSTPLIACCLSRGKATQEALNEVYELPQWNLASRLAQSLNIIFCVVMYAGGMPILYLLGVLYCLVAYWMDRLCLLRGSCRPPAYKEDIMKMMGKLLPFAAMLHTLVAAWTFGNQLLFPSADSSLRPLAELVFRMDQAKYEEVMEAYRKGTQQGLTLSFTMARMVDFSRQGALLLLLIFLAGCTYYVVYYLWALLLQFFLNPVFFLVRECFYTRMKEVKQLRHFAEVQEPVALPFPEAKLEMEAKGMTTSYKLSHNPNYRAAYKALEHAAKSASRHSTQTATLHATSMQIELKSATSSESLNTQAIPSAKNDLQHGSVADGAILQPGLDSEDSRAAEHDGSEEKHEV